MIDINLEEKLIALENIVEVARLKRYETLVQMIANEPLELSWEKIQWQRNHWKKLAQELVDEDRIDTEPETELKDDF